MSNREISPVFLVELLERSIVKYKKPVEICFLIDFTGSMLPYITKLRKCLIAIIDELNKRTKQNFSYSMLGYRSLSTKFRQFDYLDFNNDSSNIESFLKSFRVFGGSDNLEEDISTALNALIKFNKWEKTIYNKHVMRNLIHITDMHQYSEEIKIFKHRLETVFKHNIHYFLIPLTSKALHIATNDRRIIIVKPNRFLPDAQPKKSVRFGKPNLVHYLH
jgi:hypothetical protein